MIQLVIISLLAFLSLCCFIVNVGAYVYDIRNKYGKEFEFGFVFVILMISMVPVLNVVCTLSNFNECITKFIKNYKKGK